MSYTGLRSDVKAFQWITIGCPILEYGMESIDLSESDIKHLKTMQGNTMGRVMGINNRSHHSNILKVLGVPTVDDVIKTMQLGSIEISSKQVPQQEICNLFF